MESLFPAWNATLRLLFRPFSLRRWIALSVICVFLGGGTSTAAFRWGFSALPFDLHTSELLFRTRLVMAQHSSLVALAVAFSLGMILGLIYARCMFRFVLIHAVVTHDLGVRAAWKNLKTFGSSYFFGLLAVLSTVCLIISGVAIISFRYVHFDPAGGPPWWIASALLVSALVAVVFMGLIIGIFIAVTRVGKA